MSQSELKSLRNLPVASVFPVAQKRLHEKKLDLQKKKRKKIFVKLLLRYYTLSTFFFVEELNFTRSNFHPHPDLNIPQYTLTKHYKSNIIFNTFFIGFCVCLIVMRID